MARLAGQDNRSYASRASSSEAQALAINFATDSESDMSSNMNAENAESAEREVGRASVEQDDGESNANAASAEREEDRDRIEHGAVEYEKTAEVRPFYTMQL